MVGVVHVHDHGAYVEYIDPKALPTVDDPRKPELTWRTEFPFFATLPVAGDAGDEKRQSEWQYFTFAIPVAVFDETPDHQTHAFWCPRHRELECSYGEMRGAIVEGRDAIATSV